MKKTLALVCLVILFTACASALRTPQYKASQGYVLITSCDTETGTKALGLMGDLTPYDYTGSLSVGDVFDPYSDSILIRNSGVIFTKGEGRNREVPKEYPPLSRITLIELWTPECGEPPIICKDVNGDEEEGYNIVPLENDVYVFQDVDPTTGLSEGSFFNGAGFYTRCESEDFKEVILVAANSDEALSGVLDDFGSALFSKTTPYEPKMTYYKTHEGFTSLVVALYADEDAAYEYDDKPLIIQGDDLGDLAASLLKVGVDSNGVAGNLIVLASAEAAFSDLEQEYTDSLAYQLFARLNRGDEFVQRAELYSCGGDGTFESAGEINVVSLDDNRYIGENGIVCSYGTGRDPVEALPLEDDVLCSLRRKGELRGNLVNYGLISETDGVTFISGLVDCATLEIADDSYSEDARSEIPSCDELMKEQKKSDPEDLECPTGLTGIEGNTEPVFGKGGYCACVQPIDDIKTPFSCSKLN